MTRQDTELATAFHEAGHAIAIVLAFRTALWLPPLAPLRPVRYVEITQDGGGCCVASDVYSPKWPIDVLVPRYRPLMEAQVCIHLAGGISEAIYRGERRGHGTLRFAERYCSMNGDLERCTDVCHELRRLIGYAFEPRDFADRTLAMLLEHWHCVEALAEALVRPRADRWRSGRADH